MRAGLFKSVLNLYDWLPAQGELRTTIRYGGTDVFVDVVFEDGNDSTEKMMTIGFTGVCCFYVSAFPGISLLNIEYEKNAPLGNLLEFEESEAAKAWSEHFQYRKIRHFQVYFLSDNRRLEVFAETFNLQPTAS